MCDKSTKVSFGVLVVTLLLSPHLYTQEAGTSGTRSIAWVGLESFMRGDVNLDGRVDISDPIRLLGFQFLGVASIPCLDAADANDDGRLIGEVTDAIFLLNYLFRSGPTTPPPAVSSCGFDPTSSLGCLESPCAPRPIDLSLTGLFRRSPEDEDVAEDPEVEARNAAWARMEHRPGDEVFPYLAERVRLETTTSAKILVIEMFDLDGAYPARIFRELAAGESPRFTPHPEANRFYGFLYLRVRDDGRTFDAATNLVPQPLEGNLEGNTVPRLRVTSTSRADFVVWEARSLDEVPWVPDLLDAVEATGAEAAGFDALNGTGLGGRTFFLTYMAGGRYMQQVLKDPTYSFFGGLATEERRSTAATASRSSRKKGAATISRSTGRWRPRRSEEEASSNSIRTRR
jgi:hypothetical protein